MNKENYLTAEKTGIRYFPKGDFWSDIFPNVRFYKQQLPKGTFKVRLGLALLRRRTEGYNWDWVLRLGQTSEVAARNCTFEKLPFGKIHLGSCCLGNFHLGKYPWEVAAWENDFMGAFPFNICSYTLVKSTKCIETMLKLQF